MPSTTIASLSLTAPPSTDLWRKPPSTSATSAPTHTLAGPHPLRAFSRARFTVSGRWSAQYDQAGLALLLSPPKKSSASQPSADSDRFAPSADSDRFAPSGDSERSAPSGRFAKWLKTGIEFYQRTPMVSTVCTDRWSDWSVFPAPEGGSATVEFRREGDKNGKGLWVYLVRGEERVPLREVAWIFADEDDGWLVEVVAYAARPAEVGAEGVGEGGEELAAEVRDVLVEFYD